MTRRSNPFVTGRRLTLSDEGEGWFTGCADVSATIESVIESNHDDNPYYVVRFDTPLEVQEAGAPTPSGFILRRYSHGVVHCRWRGADINTDAPVSVHVLLVPPGTELPTSKADLASITIRAWAGCILGAGLSRDGDQGSRLSPRAARRRGSPKGSGGAEPAWSYSVRRASEGWTFAARHAGTRLATNETASRMAAALNHDAGSDTRMP
jgi:hypothetical protein